MYNGNRQEIDIFVLLIFLFHWIKSWEKCWMNVYFFVHIQDWRYGSGHTLRCFFFKTAWVQEISLVYYGSYLWNRIIKKIFKKWTPNKNNMIPGSKKFSIFLLETLQISIPGRAKEWMPHKKWEPFPSTLPFI